MLSTTFDKYCYTTVRHCPPFFDYHTQVRYSRTESVRKTEDIQHPLVRNAMIFAGVHNLSIAYDADLPARSGLGSSSSFAVGLLQAFYSMNGRYASPKKLAEDAIYVERKLCRESGGWQDQIAAAYGGMNRIDFNDSGFSVTPVVIPKDRKQKLEQHLMMFFTGISRYSSQIAITQEGITKNKTAELHEMKKLVDEAEKILLCGGDLADFGRLLHYTWQLKRGLTTDISTSAIDDIYRCAMKAGAIGGKLLGAGGGGFILFYADPERHKAIMSALSELVYVPISFENEGTKVLYYTPEDYDYEVKTDGKESAYHRNDGNGWQPLGGLSACTY